MTLTTPDIHPRPAFDAWLRLRRLDYTWAGKQLSRTREYVRRICLPFDDPNRLDPSARVIRDIIKLTEGAVRADDWHPPVAEILSGRAA